MVLDRNRIGVPWPVMISVWWSMTWRWSLGCLIADFILAISSRAMGASQDIVDLLTGICAVALSIWALGRALECRHKQFSITIKRNGAPDDIET